MDFWEMAEAMPKLDLTDLALLEIVRLEPGISCRQAAREAGIPYAQACVKIKILAKGRRKKGVLHGGLELIDVDVCLSCRRENSLRLTLKGKEILTGLKKGF